MLKLQNRICFFYRLSTRWPHSAIHLRSANFDLFLILPIHPLYGANNASIVANPDEKLSDREEQPGHKEKSQQDGTSTGESVTTTCGYTDACKPAFLQRFANPKAYVVIMSLIMMLQGFAVNGINNVNTSTYERRYLLSSKSSGFITSIYAVTAGLTATAVGYFGTHAHQPRILGFATLALAAGTCVMSLSHFTAPHYEPLFQSESCILEGDPICDTGESQSYLKNYLFIFLFGQALNGFSGTCLYSLGITYLDESVTTKMSPLYYGIMTACNTLGGAIGYIAGGFFLDLYVDITINPPHGLTVEDPSWVGAWWIGFIISACLAVLLSLMVFCFPKELPGTKEIRAGKISQCHDNGVESTVNSTEFGVSIRDFPRAVWYLCKNPAYMCLTGVLTVERILISGFSTFIPKIVNNQFGQTAGMSAIIVGCVGMPSCVIGMLLGGFLCKKFQLKIHGMILFSLGAAILTLVAIPVFWARCADGSLAGVLVDYPGESVSSLGDITAPCNEDCSCTTERYHPVCADGIEYFSPCHAGCMSGRMSNADGKKIYQNCSCPASVAAGAHKSSNFTVIAGKCENDCAIMLFAIFLPVCFIVLLGTFLMATPLNSATLRVVSEKQRTFAVSFQWVFLRLIGGIPGPLLFGAVIDSSCTLWEKDCDGNQGSCWVYDNFEMSKRLFILMFTLKLFSIMFNIAAYITYKAPSESIYDTNEKETGMKHAETIDSIATQNTTLSED